MFLCKKTSNFFFSSDKGNALSKLLYLDLSRAVDILPGEVLLIKMKKIEINVTITLWLIITDEPFNLY